MQDIDQALARAYERYERAAAVPRTAAPPVPPGPHFTVETPTPRDPVESAGAVAEGMQLAWPEIVRSLERSHGGRFEALADALIAARDRRNVKVLLFTSPHRAEGRTTVVLALARALARRPGRTLLVDGDLGGPMLARQLGLHPRFGLEDVVEDGHAIADALIVAPDDHLTILPLGAAIARPREFFASSGWSRLMGRMRREFDMILIDGGPMSTGLSAAVLPSGVDAAVLVHHKTRTSERAILRAQDALDAAGVPLLGLAETFCA